MTSGRGVRFRSGCHGRVGLGARTAPAAPGQSGGSGFSIEVAAIAFTGLIGMVGYAVQAQKAGFRAQASLGREAAEREKAEAWAGKQMERVQLQMVECAAADGGAGVAAAGRTADSPGLHIILIFLSTQSTEDVSATELQLLGSSPGADGARRQGPRVITRQAGLARRASALPAERCVGGAVCGGGAGGGGGRRPARAAPRREPGRGGWAAARFCIYHTCAIRALRFALRARCSSAQSVSLGCRLDDPGEGFRGRYRGFLLGSFTRPRCRRPARAHRTSLSDRGCRPGLGERERRRTTLCVCGEGLRLGGV
jgi:hypothetical protein